MFFRQIFEEGLAQASYIVGCPASEEALVVDPRRDVDVYIKIARANDLKIVGVTETHIHADFLSGSRELAAATGATLHLSGLGGPDWSYAADGSRDVRLLADGDRIDIGRVSVDVVHSPGHTPEHLSFVVREATSAPGPMIAMTGDFVFVGDIGRPDLLEAAVGIAGSADAGARTMYRSLGERFWTLPDYVQIWPGHGAGSACGKALGAVPASTAGYEKLTAWWPRYVRENDTEGFVRELLDGQPDAPSYFTRMKRLNRDGAPILGSLPKPRRLDAAGLRDALLGGAAVIDTRDRAAFKEGHIKGALSILDESTFSTRAGWFVSPEVPIVLVAPPARVDALVRALVRVGLDRVVGFVASDDTAATKGMKLEGARSTDVMEARGAWQNDGAVVLDVRSSVEYRQGHIPGALHVPAGRLVSMIDRVPRDKRIVVHCAGGGRAAASASVLSAHGFDDVDDMLGGLDAWEAAGNPVEIGDSVAAR